MPRPTQHGHLLDGELAEGCWAHSEEDDESSEDGGGAGGYSNDQYQQEVPQHRNAYHQPEAARARAGSPWFDEDSVVAENVWRSPPMGASPSPVRNSPTTRLDCRSVGNGSERPRPEEPGGINLANRLGIDAGLVAALFVAAVPVALVCIVFWRPLVASRIAGLVMPYLSDTPAGVMTFVSRFLTSPTGMATVLAIAAAVLLLSSAAAHASSPERDSAVGFELREGELVYEDECCVARAAGEAQSVAGVHLVVSSKDDSCPRSLASASGHGKLLIGSLMVGAAKAAQARGLGGEYRLLVHGGGDHDGGGLRVHVLGDAPR